MTKIRRSVGMLPLGALLLATSALTAHAAPPVPTNLPGVTAKLEVPPSFDPLSASADELESAGFPPRPDAVKAPHAYESWKRAMTSGAKRVLPTLTQTDIKHGPHVPATKNGTSNNWSGYTVLNSATSYGSSSFYFLVGDYVEPVAEQAFGACTGGWDYSSAWVGIDGYGTGDVLQAGSEADAYCSGSSKNTYYSFWYEWYPAGSVRIGSFPIAPGDDIFAEVWSTNNTTGHAYLVNYNNNQSVSLTFYAPSGTHLVGNSAEWIVERPGVGGGLSTLSNYIEDFFEDAYAYDFSNHYSYPGAPYSGLSSVPVTMVDNSGYGISYPSLLGTSGIYFYDANSARNASSP